MDDDLDIVCGCAAVHPDQRGGQHVARSCTGARVTHRPTGISVLCVDGRSQRANLESAKREVLRLVEARR